MKFCNKRVKANYLIFIFFKFISQDSPLSSKVAMFNNAVSTHKDSQLLNPFSQDGRSSPRPQFTKEEYGKPKVGSLTEARGQKAAINVFKNMLELCEIINNSGYQKSKEEPDLAVILFGELFNVSFF